MRKAGRLVAETLALIEEHVKPGVSTQALNDIAEAHIRQGGGIPSFLDYQGFPASICASPNEVVVHGIPSEDVVLQDGDIISIDVGAIVDGYHGDAARTFPCGEISADVRQLIDVTRESFFKGLDQALAGNRLSDISHAIQAHTEAYGYGVVRDFCGHGIGSSMHEAPQIPNYGNPGFGPRLRPGMCLAVEPMINMGTYEVEVLADGWTTVTKDGKWSCHYENTFVITEDRAEILTTL